MTSCKHVLYTSLAAVSLLTPGLYAQDLEEEGEQLAPLYVNEIEIGIGFNTDDSYKFGKFNGLDEEGAYFIGNFDLRQSRIAGDSSSDYWELAGRNLGLDGRSVFGEYARAGSFKIYLDYDERINNLFDDGMTPYRGAGTSRLTLPSTWVAGSSVNGLTQLFPSLQGVTIEKDRQKVGGGISYDINDIWQVSSNYHHEYKDGTDDFGAIFGSSGGNPRGAVVPIPHEFEFDEFDAGIIYKGDAAQFTLSYNLSIFNNQIKSLIFDNAFNNTQWPAAARSTTGNLVQGQVSNVFPDNEAWSINFSGGYNIAAATRLTVNATYGEMTQDETFLPYSIIPALYNVPGLEALPRDNLDGEIANTYVNLNLTHRINSELDAKARFTYDDRDNNTPRDVYHRIAGDSQLQSAGTARLNRPYSLERMKFEVEGGYRLPRMSKLTAGYTYEDKDRDYQEVDNTTEHAFQVRFSSMPAEWISGWAKYRFSTLDGGDNVIPSFYQSVLDAAAGLGFSLDRSVTDVGNYFGNRPFLEGEDPEEIEAEVAAFLAAPTAAGFNALFENDPFMRKFYMANRDQDQFNLNVNLYPTPEWTMNILGKYTSNDYDDSPTGMQESTLESLTFDLVYAPSDRFSANAFFTVEKNDYDQRAWRHAGGQYVFLSEADRSAGTASPLTGANGFDYYTEDSIYTTGINFAWNVIEDKFDLDLDMTYSDATTDVEPIAENYALSSGLGGAPISFPDVETRVYRLMLTGDYKFRDNWGTRVYYWYERFDSTDFELDDVGVDALNLIPRVTGSTSGGSVILLGNQAPSYNNHVIGFTLYRKF